MKQHFINWLEDNIPKSVKNYTSGFNTINRICQSNGFESLEGWDKTNFDSNHNALIQIDEFLDLNKSGNNILSATLSNLKKYLTMTENPLQIPPVKPFENFKWRWAVTTPSEGINTENILFGVLEILVKYNGLKHTTQLFQDDLVKLQTKIHSPIDLAKVDRGLNKNIIENSGQYWKALGLINTTSDGLISVTDLGIGIINGDISKIEFIKYLYDNFTLPNVNIESKQVIDEWAAHEIKIRPIRLIFDILHRITKRIQSPLDWFITPEELKRIIVPLSLNSNIDIDLYIDHIFKFRKNPDAYLNWPDCTPGDNDFRMLKEYLLFLFNFGFLDSVEIKDKQKKYYINESSLKVIGKIVDIDNEDIFKPSDVTQIPFQYKDFHKITIAAKLFFSEKLTARFVASLCTKPFVICTGLSGSGKTKLAQSFVKWICESKKQYKIIPVGADWTNREPLLGYPNGLDGTEYVLSDSGALEVLLEAISNEDKPYFLVLDEMNLSHVERYFADFLSVMESTDKINLYSGDNRKCSIKEKLENEISWPKNLFIIGTVNIDETTYMFSPKVLDRANVIEFRLENKDMEQYLANAKPIEMGKLCSNNTDIGLGSNMAIDFLNLAWNKQHSNKAKNALKKFFPLLQKAGAEFGYRSAYEISCLVGVLENLVKKDSKWDNENITDEDLVDIAIMQKLLPKLHGSRARLIPVLTSLGKLCITGGAIDYEETDKGNSSFIKENFDKEPIKNIIYKISFDKLKRMYKNVIANGFTSYAEA